MLSTGPADSNRNWISSDIKVFESLFPGEDSTRIKQPISLNVPDQSDQNLSWMCFDYKGASFMCKPSTGNITVESAKNLNSWFNSGLRQQAVYNSVSNSKPTYWFGGSAGDGQFARLTQSDFGEGVISPQAKSVVDYWGRVHQDIKTTIDAALCVLDDSGVDEAVYLFSGNEYLKFSLGVGIHDLKQADSGYPKLLGQNGGDFGLPDQPVTGAFHYGNKNYFTRGQHWESINNAGTKTIMDYPLWPRADTTEQDLGVDEITGVFEYNQQIYLVYGYDKIKLYGAISLRSQLTQELTDYYDEPGDVVQPYNFSEGFSYDGKAYFREVVGGVHKRAFINTATQFITDNDGGNRYGLYSSGGNYRLYIPQSWVVTLFEASSASSSEQINSIFYYKDRFYMLQGSDYVAFEQIDMSGDFNLRSDSSAIDSLTHFIDGADIDAAFNVDGVIKVYSGERYVSYDNFSNIKNGVFDGPKSIYAPTRDFPMGTEFIASFESSSVSGGGRYFVEDGYFTRDKMNVTIPHDTNWRPERNELMANGGQVDAVFEQHNKIYLLTGDYYYRYSDLNKLDELMLMAPGTLTHADVAADDGYPKTIAGNNEGIYHYRQKNPDTPLHFAFTTKDNQFLVGGNPDRHFTNINERGRVVAIKPMSLDSGIATELDITDVDQINLMFNHGSYVRVVTNNRYVDLSSVSGLIPDAATNRYDIVRLS
ncbi:MAG: hypothetical protein HRT35_27575 [Algicola sp.]|nr:hypothetical protein [Algicola sp.]